MINRIIYISFLLLGMFFFHSCDVAHTNPLDPENPDGNVKYVIGKTFLHNPLIGIPSFLPGTKVYFENESDAVYSDAEGNFVIPCRNPVNQKLFFEHSRFISDSTVVNWADERIVKLNSTLYRKPDFDTLLYYTSVQLESDLPSKVELHFKIVPEPEDRGLVDSINLVNHELNVNYHLFDAVSPNYENHISASNLNFKNLDAVLGHKFSIMVFTGKIKQFNLQNVQFARFMNTAPVGSPGNGETVNSDTVNFNWPKLNVSYNVSYGIMIFYVDVKGNDILLFTDLNIKAGVTEYKYVFDSFYNTKKIIWRLVAIDEFGDQIISEPYSFIYKPVFLR